MTQGEFSQSPIVGAMPDSFDPGRMTSSIENGVLMIQRRTYRSGDFVHVIFSFFAALFAILFLVVTIANDTLFDGLSTPIVILVLASYGYFGLTRLVNRRTVTVTGSHVAAKDGPLPQLIRSVDADLARYGKVEVRSAMRFTFPPTTRYRLYYVGGEMAPDLFRRLHDENEAKYAVARIRAFTSGPA
ncbi:MAG: hypothetical protein U9N79_07650 [Actinomycetota bacterium]|nr:hypothetical protein [Actinomycetota bacterium]